MNDLPEPLTPPACDLRDFSRMMIDIPRLFASGFNATASRSPLAWMIGHKLWYRSWHQVPAGSLPDDDDELCHLVELGFDVRSFRKAKPAAMRGWVKCTDGRLYHPIVAEVALESWLEKLAQRLSSGAGNAKRWKSQFDPAPIEGDIAMALDRLRALNPNSRSIAKASRRGAASGHIAIPPGSQDDPGGTADVVPMQSQGTGTGTGTGNQSNVDERERELESEPWPSSGDPGRGLSGELARVLTAAGIPLDPSDRRWADELQRLKGWLDQGIDLEAEILPAVDRAVKRLRVDDTLSTLKPVERELFGGRAKARVSTRSAPAEPPAVAKAGEGDAIARWRAAIMSAIGVSAYRCWLDETSACVVDDYLEIVAPSAFAASRIEAEYLPQLERTAASILKCGLVRVRIAVRKSGAADRSAPLGLAAR